MLDNPQSKLNQQARSQPSLNSKQEESKGNIESQGNQRPLNSTPDKGSRLQPDTNPKLNDSASAPITDEAGKTRTVPEAENESGFKAQLKAKLMDTVMSKMTESNSADNANGDLKPEKQPTKQVPDPNLGKPAPEHQKPKPDVPKPGAPQPQMPKFSKPRIPTPKFGRLPRF